MRPCDGDRAIVPWRFFGHRIRSAGQRDPGDCLGQGLGKLPVLLLGEPQRVPLARIQIAEHQRARRDLTGHSVGSAIVIALCRQTHHLIGDCAQGSVVGIAAGLDLGDGLTVPQDNIAVINAGGAPAQLRLVPGGDLQRDLRPRRVAHRQRRGAPGRPEPISIDHPDPGHILPVRQELRAAPALIRPEDRPGAVIADLHLIALLSRGGPLQHRPGRFLLHRHAGLGRRRNDNDLGRIGPAARRSVGIVGADPPIKRACRQRICRDDGAHRRRIGLGFQRRPAGAVGAFLQVVAGGLGAGGDDVPPGKGIGRGAVQNDAVRALDLRGAGGVCRGEGIPVGGDAFAAVGRHRHLPLQCISAREGVCRDGAAANRSAADLVNCAGSALPPAEGGRGLRNLADTDAICLHAPPEDRWLCPIHKSGGRGAAGEHHPNKIGSIQRQLQIGLVRSVGRLHRGVVHRIAILVAIALEANPISRCIRPVLILAHS